MRRHDVVVDAFGVAPHLDNGEMVRPARLLQDIEDACSTLDQKGGAHESERAKVKQGSGY